MRGEFPSTSACRLWLGRLLELCAGGRHWLRRATAWAHPRRHPWRLLLLMVLLSLPQLRVTLAVPDLITKRLNWDEYHILQSLNRDHSLRAAARWFYGDWVEGNRFYRPLTSVSLWLDYLIWGNRHRGYLFTSWLLLGPTAWLLALLISRVLRHADCGLLAGASLALLTPLSTRFILKGMANRGDALCAAWTLLALVTAMCWINRGGGRWLAATLLAGLGALWSKEMALGLPLWILLCGGLGAGRQAWRRTVGVSAATAALVVLWAFAYQTFVSQAVGLQAALIPARLGKQLTFLTLHAVAPLHLWALWLAAGANLVSLLFRLKLVIGTLLITLGLVLVLQRIPRALLFFLGWEVIAWIPLLPVRLSSWHYDYIPELGRHVLWSAFVWAGLQEGMARASCRRHEPDRRCDGGGRDGSQAD